MIVLRWGDFLRSLDSFPDTDAKNDRMELIRQAKNLLKDILSGDIALDTLAALTDDVFATATDMAQEEVVDPLLQQAQNEVSGEEAWSTVVNKLRKLSGLSDPSMAEVFI